MQEKEMSASSAQLPVLPGKHDHHEPFVDVAVDVLTHSVAHGLPSYPLLVAPFASNPVLILVRFSPPPVSITGTDSLSLSLSLRREGGKERDFYEARASQ